MNRVGASGRICAGCFPHGRPEPGGHSSGDCWIGEILVAWSPRWNYSQWLNVQEETSKVWYTCGLYWDWHYFVFSYTMGLSAPSHLQLKQAELMHERAEMPTRAMLIAWWSSVKDLMWLCISPLPASGEKRWKRGNISGSERKQYMLYLCYNAINAVLAWSIYQSNSSQIRKHDLKITNRVLKSS